MRKGFLVAIGTSLVTVTLARGQAKPPVDLRATLLPPVNEPAGVAKDGKASPAQLPADQTRKPASRPTVLPSLRRNLSAAPAPAGKETGQAERPRAPGQGTGAVSAQDSNAQTRPAVPPPNAAATPPTLAQPPQATFTQFSPGYPLIWGSADYLLWFVKSGPVNGPLVTSGSPADFVPGDPGTTPYSSAVWR